MIGILEAYLSSKKKSTVGFLLPCSMVLVKQTYNLHCIVCLEAQAEQWMTVLRVVNLYNLQLFLVLQKETAEFLLGGKLATLGGHTDKEASLLAFLILCGDGREDKSNKLLIGLLVSKLTYFYLLLALL